MQRIGLIVFAEFQLMGLNIATVFELANRAAESQLYDIRVLSERGGLVGTSNGITVDTAAFDDSVYDTLIVTGNMSYAPASAAFIRFLKTAPDRTRRLAAICSGAFFLAEAGLLDGRRATTHWARARELQTRFPNVKVEEDRIFIADGMIWTSAGMTAGIDLALAMVANDMGDKMAKLVARTLVMFQRRSGGQSQHSALLELDAKTDRIQRALAFAKENLSAPLSVEQLAEAAHLSPRQFSRAFRAETGQSPAKAVENLRVEAARLMMDQGRHSIDVVARETGFADPERMRRAFRRAFGQSPQAIKRVVNAFAVPVGQVA